MQYKNNIQIEDKDLHLDKKAFIDIVNSQLFNENIYVGICELGYCVRAKRLIKKGEVIYTFEGEIISFEQTKERGEYECMSLQIDHNKYIDTKAPGRYVNHSCEPNTGIMSNYNLVALEDIAIHDEIRFDYSTTMDEDHYQMECKCGKPNCRGIVTDFKLLPVVTKQKYFRLNIVMDFIKRQYEHSLV